MLPENIIYIDIEASGLHASSYPIEIGWCQPLAGLPGGSTLIAPMPTWSETDWHCSAQEVHGIERWETELSGRDATELAHELNDRFHGKLVFSDHPGMEQQWLDRLFKDAGVRQRFWVRDMFEALGAALSHAPSKKVAERAARVAVTAVWQTQVVVHRALPDARRWAGLHAVLADPAVLGEIDEAVADLGVDEMDDAGHFAGMVALCYESASAKASNRAA